MPKLSHLVLIGSLGIAAQVLPAGFAAAQTKEAAAPRAAAAPAAAGPQKIAIIDLERVFLESHQFQQLREELKELQASKQQKMEQLQQQKKALVQDVQEQQLGPDSEEYLSKEEEVIRIDNSAKTFAAVAKQQLGRRQAEVTAEMYGVVQKALDKFAEANGYAFVLNAHQLSEGSENPQELQRTMFQTVSWHRGREDITDSMIQYLNQRYDATAEVQPASGASTGKPKATTAEGTRSAAKPSTGAKPAGTAKPAAGQPAKRTAEAPARKTTK